jgi:hypothetical protein
MTYLPDEPPTPDLVPPKSRGAGLFLNLLVPGVGLSYAGSVGWNLVWLFIVAPLPAWVLFGLGWLPITVTLALYTLCQFHYIHYIHYYTSKASEIDNIDSTGTTMMAVISIVAAVIPVVFISALKMMWL